MTKRVGHRANYGGQCKEAQADTERKVPDTMAKPLAATTKSTGTLNGKTSKASEYGDTKSFDKATAGQGVPDTAAEPPAATTRAGGTTADEMVSSIAKVSDREKELGEAFQVIDWDGSCFISVREIVSVMLARYTEKQHFEAFNGFDRDGNRFI